MRKLLLISMMIVMGFNLYSENELFAEEPVSAWLSQDGKVTVVQIETGTVDYENWPILKRYPLLSATAEKGVQARKQGQCNRPYSCNPRRLLLNAKLRQFERSTERSHSQEKL